MKFIRFSYCAIVILAITSCFPSKQEIRDKKDAVTIRSLEKKTIEITKSQVDTGGLNKIKQRYREFVKNSDDSPLRAHAEKRLADLQMLEDEKITLSEDQRAAEIKSIKLYQSLLKRYPNDPRNVEIVYQLSNAYRQIGNSEKSLQYLTLLTEEYPRSKYTLEAHFRRAEIMFSLQRYKKAATAYREVMSFESNNLFYEKALSKYGWCLYQQSRYEEAMEYFYRVLDRKLTSEAVVQDFVNHRGLSRADREIVGDTLRVISLTLFYGKKETQLHAFTKRRYNRPYKALIFQRLSELFLERERVSDASATYELFYKLQPYDPHIPFLHLKILDAFKENKFGDLYFESKQAFVERYNKSTEFWVQNNKDQGLQQKLQPLVRKHLSELAAYYHAKAQKSKQIEDYEKALPWYRMYVNVYGDDPQAVNKHFLMAELLFEAKKYKDAARAYGKVAYSYPFHKNTTEAAYAEVLSYKKLEEISTQDRDKQYWYKIRIDTAFKFSEKFPADKRTPKLLLNVAQGDFKLNNKVRAVMVAKKIIALRPQPDVKYLRTSWTILANNAFENQNYAEAESSYASLMSLSEKGSKTWKEAQEQLAASIYKQGEAQRKQGNEAAALGHFQRVVIRVPNSSIRVTAEFDAAVSMIVLKQWSAATQALEGFYNKHPNHPLAAQARDKLLVVYSENGDWQKAAQQYERLANRGKSARDRRNALLQAGELYEKARQPKEALRVYKVYIKEFPRPLDENVEIQQKLADYYAIQKNWKAHIASLQGIIATDKAAGRASTDRSRFLAAQATLRLAEPYYKSFVQVKLVRPLKKSLKKKKAKMQAALKAFGRAADYKVAEVTTASTYRIGEIYREFGKALMRSQRPKGLSKEELEQYEIMLEEQAFPFEEKAIKLHTTNTQRVASGIYDKWVKRSFSSLGKLVPARYGKNEKSEVAIGVLQ